tara:strand:- start:2611 stop:2982 length:372 start_codon:yes stop_codon:yes gene_type:complete
MAGGNYGGNSIPTTPIAGSTLLTGAGTTYSAWTCTKAIATTVAATFTVDGVAIPISTIGDSVDLIFTAPNLSAASNITFLCYDCSCDGPMNGIIDASITADGFYSGQTAWNQPTIIGGGGLNS